MGLFSSGKTYNTLEDLFKDQLADLYDAEQRLVTALPKMVAAAHSSALKAAFQQHLTETQAQVTRMEQVFQACGYTAKAETCQAMKGLLLEGEAAINASGDPDVVDAALIASAQRVEHYEIAGYGTARTFAQRLGKTEAVRLLQQTLDEEGATDKKLTKLAESSINPAAAQA